MRFAGILREGRGAPTTLRSGMLREQPRPREAPLKAPVK
jgi:hypothetical protein